MCLEYFPPKPTFFLGITELDLFWHREHGVELNDLNSSCLLLSHKTGFRLRRSWEEECTYEGKIEALRRSVQRILTLL